MCHDASQPATDAVLREIGSMTEEDSFKGCSNYCHDEYVLIQQNLGLKRVDCCFLQTFRSSTDALTMNKNTCLYEMPLLAPASKHTRDIGGNRLIV